MKKKFDDVKNEFEKLKQSYRHNDISEKEFRARLKRLQIKDGQGRSWTIGARTGDWYYYDGEEWIQATPPSLQDRKAICIYCGSENELDTEVCAKCGDRIYSKKPLCPDCGEEIEDPEGICSFCQEVPKESGNKPVQAPSTPSDNERTLLSLQPSSFFTAFGGVGLFVGIILGAFAGATELLEGIHALMPSFIHDFHKTLSGGFIYGFFGGLYGFFGAGICGFLLAIILNLSISFFGGIKIRIDS